MEKVSNKSQELQPSIEGSNIKALSSEKLEILDKLGCAETILREPASVTAINSLSPKKLEIMSRFGSWYFEKILRHPPSVEAVNSLNTEKFEVIGNLHDKFLRMQQGPCSFEDVNYLNHKKSDILLSKLNVTWFGKILQNPIAVQAVNSLNTEKLEMLADIKCSDLERILKNPVYVAGVNSMNTETFKTLNKYMYSKIGLLEILQYPTYVEAVNSVVPEKLEIMINCKSWHLSVRLLQDPTAVQAVNSLTTKKFEIISELHPLWFQKILQDPTYVGGMISLSYEKLEILISKLNQSWFGRKLKNNADIMVEAYLSVENLEILISELHVTWFRIILGYPAFTEAVNSLSPEKFEIISKLNVMCFESLFQDPASVRGVNSLSTAKLSAVVDIIEAKGLQDTILDALTIQRILDVDIERNIRFISLLENKTENSVDRDLNFYLDNEAICKHAIDVIDLYDLTANERVQNTLNNVVHLVFQGNRYNYWTSRLQELSLFECLKQL